MRKATLTVRITECNGKVGMRVRTRPWSKWALDTFCTAITLGHVVSVNGEPQP